MLFHVAQDRFPSSTRQEGKAEAGDRLGSGVKEMLSGERRMPSSLEVGAVCDKVEGTMQSCKVSAG